MGHVGLLPQSVNQLGGYRVQGRQDEVAARLRADVEALREAGVFSVVLEAMDPELCSTITRDALIPTIGIGAGRGCDGQVLVISDLAGLLPGSVPKFVKQYAEVHRGMAEAVRAFAEDVRTGRFPEERHEY
jgi:3-methyl-2-oxobutanoate hydroxymethyltransferase